MKIPVVLTLCGQQTYVEQEPEKIELVTEGILEKLPFGWRLSYQESALTGLDGVTTSFLIQDGQITLTRSGQLQSEMVFREGISHDSLYQMEFGAMLITVCASKLSWNLTEEGGVIDLRYAIQIEQAAAGSIDYHFSVCRK